MPYKPNPLIPETIPVELDPVYRTDCVNAPVCLYSGPLELNEEDRAYSGYGEIQLERLPVPRIMFKAEFPGWKLQPGPFRWPEGSLKMTDGRSVKFHATDFKPSISENAAALSVSGVIEPSEFECGDSVTSVLLHIPNFQSLLGSPVRDDAGSGLRMARTVLAADDWRITLDELKANEDGTSRSFPRWLADAGGFGITHVAKLEQSDGGSFSTTNARDIEEALFWFRSFSRGIWVSPVLAIGFDSHGARVWEEWRVRKIERWRIVESWLDIHPGVGVHQTFPGFIRRRNDAVWKKVIELAIHWYVESNMCAGAVEGGTIFAQAAFELLAWTLLVEDHKVVSRDGFGKLPASDQLRLLFSTCKIPLTIPSSMQELSKKAAACTWADAPEAIVQVRNALVHANPKKRKKVLADGDDGVRTEAWWLGLWYLELVLLWLFDFRGEYSNRLVRSGTAEQKIQLVPWAVSP